MSVVIHNKKLSDFDEYSYNWIASNQYGVGNDGEEKILCDNRDKILLIGTIDDDEASYSYDDWALIKLKNKYYLLATSGCSCPSPSETWRIEIGPTTKAKVKEHILSGNYEGYTMPKRQLDQFLELFNFTTTAKDEK